MILELTYFEIMKLIVGCALAGIPVGALMLENKPKFLSKAKPMVIIAIAIIIIIFSLYII